MAAPSELDEEGFDLGERGPNFEDVYCASLAASRRRHDQKRLVMGPNTWYVLRLHCSEGQCCARRNIISAHNGEIGPPIPNHGADYPPIQ